MNNSEANLVKKNQDKTTLEFILYCLFLIDSV